MGQSIRMLENISYKKAQCLTLSGIFVSLVSITLIDVMTSIDRSNTVLGISIAAFLRKCSSF